MISRHTALSRVGHSAVAAIMALGAACREAPDRGTAEAVSDSVALAGEVTMPAPADTIELGPRISARGLSFRPPARWTHLPATSPIRIAQFVIPPGGVSNFGELVVFHFGPGEGGTAQDNVAEWIDLFQTTEGDPVEDQADVDHFEVGELLVTTLRVTGVMRPSLMAGPDAAHLRPGWEMLAAVVEGPGGPWFFKATGPRASMERAEHRFGRMLRTIRLERMP